MVLEFHSCFILCIGINENIRSESVAKLNRRKRKKKNEDAKSESSSHLVKSMSAFEHFKSNVQSETGDSAVPSCKKSKSEILVQQI